MRRRPGNGRCGVSHVRQVHCVLCVSGMFKKGKRIVGKKIVMYIPIAIYKNNAVLIDSMDTFALYFCSSVKQKMRPTVPEAGVDFGADGVPGLTGGEDEFGGAGAASDELFTDSALDDDDDL